MDQPRPQPEGKIVVRRVFEIYGIARRLRINVDGVSVARLWSGGQAEISIPEGNRAIQARMGRFGSPLRYIDVKAGHDSPEVVVSFSRGAFFKTMYAPSQVLSLHLESEAFPH